MHPLWELGPIIPVPLFSVLGELVSGDGAPYRATSLIFPSLFVFIIETQRRQTFSSRFSSRLMSFEATINSPFIESKLIFIMRDIVGHINVQATHIS